MARESAERSALAQHQPPDGTRLLGVAHSARIREHEHRDRGRRRSASLLAVEPVRARARLAARVRASMRRGRGDLPGSPRGFPGVAPLRPRLRAGVLPGRLVARRRGRRLHGSVLLPRIGLHRDRQRLRRRSDRPHRAGRRRPRAGRGVQHELPSPVRGVPASLQRPVSAHGQRAGDDGQGGVGQRRVLGDHRPAVLPAPVHPSGVHAVHRSADAAILRPARAHAAALQRMGPRGSRASTRTRSRTS